MKLRWLLGMGLLVVAAVNVTQASILLKNSLLRPRLPEPCFTCRAEDRPLIYPLIAFFVKIKDKIVRGLNVIAANTKEYKLD